MKKIIILILSILLLCGCHNNKDLEHERCLEIFCDKEYGVEYIRDICAYRGGISVRLDSNGHVISCKREVIHDDKN